MPSKRDFFHTGLEVSRSQIAALLGMFTPGDIYYVDYRKGNDPNDGLTWKTALRTYSEAIRRVTSNNNDVILIDGDSTVEELAMVYLTKNRVHTIGMNGFAGHMGNGAKISMGITTAVTDFGTFQNSGVRNTFTGIRFMNGNTEANALYNVKEGGEFTRYQNCEFYKSSHLDHAVACDFLHNGDSTMHYNCTFGSTANETGDIRPNMNLTQILAGKKCRDAYLENCLFLSKADDTDKVMVYGDNATDVERMLTMKNCTFVNNLLSAGTPAHAVGFGAAQTQGSVLLQDCASVDCTVMAEAGVAIYVAGGSAPAHATTGIAVTA